MKEKIVAKATEMFLKLGFKSVTMDDIACEMCISKKTIYKFFMNKELLIEEGTEKVQAEIRSKIAEIQSKEYNSIEENFVIRRMFSELFKTSESPLYQLKKHYPQIHDKVRQTQIQQCGEMFKNNIITGPAASATRAICDVSLRAAAGRTPMSVHLTVTLAVAAGHRAFSSSVARSTAARSLASTAASSTGDSERRSTSMAPNGEMVFTDVPPDTIPTLKVVLGDIGTWKSPIRAMARPMA